MAMSLETPIAIRTLQRKLYRKAKQEPDFRFYLLYDKIYREDVLRHAYELAKANKGAPGVDGQTFEAIETEGLEKWMEGIRKDLRDKTYKPQPVRRVLIPKPGGGERPLGIPTIRDRTVQTAAKLVLEPIFEADLEPEAYGYRPKRSAHDAIQKVHKLLVEGYTDVVDADLSKYFDTIPHTELLKSVPQGGIVSPMLANLYMNRFLKHWQITGKSKAFRAQVVTYADDFVILSRGHAAEALNWTRSVMTRLGLTLNEAKTSIKAARKESFHFLGYTFGPHRYKPDGHWYLGASPSKKSRQRIKQKVGGLLRPVNVGEWEAVRARLNQILRGWSAYFSYGSRATAYREVNNYVSDRVRHFLKRRHKVQSRGTEHYGYQRIFGELKVLRLGPPPRIA
ncbi:MAG: group II intron reverse transcriptase/maturase [Verrucomicrobia bacterium]|nr:MAG: group II intron reverse transcriptase/maturase [Verrucomicrobiota bacterium]